MEREGTVVLLGAGASADAGYPTADALLTAFEEIVREETQTELEIREQIKQHHAEERARAAKEPMGESIVLLPPMQNTPTTEQWFREMWGRFESTVAKLRPLAVPSFEADGRPRLPTPVIYGPHGVPMFPPYPAVQENLPPSPPPMPYLENFFAFYDDYLRPTITAREGDPAAVAALQHRFRTLRELALKAAYRLLTPHEHPAAEHLRRLYDIRGSLGYASVTATLNLDVAMEHMADRVPLPISDGFAREPSRIAAMPEEWNSPDLGSLRRLWAAVQQNGIPFAGMEDAPANAHLLLKLHGSLGWYVLEEGAGDIGARDDLRHNTVYHYFRLPYGALWNSESRLLMDQLATGGQDDPVTRYESTESVTRKAGALWVRPYMVFARALKAHPDRVFLDLTSMFARLLDAARSIAVIGYAWADPHVNDLLFDAVAGGAALVNVSRSAVPDYVLALWAQRLPTTFHLVRRRLFMFGGGAKQVLEGRRITLPSGEVREFDLVAALQHGLPAELSLDQTFKV